MAAAAGDIDTKELEICIKGLLTSKPTVVKANVLLRECEELIGKTFPFKSLGFHTFVDYLKSIPTVVQLEPHNGYNPDVYPVASAASQHIDQLVSRQRVAPSKRRGVARRGVARRGAYNSRPPMRRRTAIVSPPTNSVARTNQGFSVGDLDNYMTRNYDKRDLTNNKIHNVDDLLYHAKGMVERVDMKVYPKLEGVPSSSDQRYANAIPAGLEDEFDDFDEEDGFYDNETQAKDSEEEMSNKAIQLWSQVLGVKEDDSSPRWPNKEKLALDSRDEAIDENVAIPEEDSNISSKMINNFRKILTEEFPDGIWASQLQQLYFEKFHVTLNLLDLGYTSVITLASSLPSVFAIKREGPHDWKLYDARYVTQQSLDSQEIEGGRLISEIGRYIPQTIIEKIKRLLDENPNGFRSTDLLQMYQDKYRKPLDVEVLGFNSLEEFLLILKNDVTLKKSLNYYLLLPKHKVVSYDDLQPPKPDERLNVPAEALCVPIPKNVMRLGEEIPLQELPPVQMDPDPNKPLMELEVRVAEVMSPAFFYITLDSKNQELDNMMDDLDKFYRWEEAIYQIPLPHLTPNLYCATKYEGFYHRAKIIRIKNHGDVEIEFIDYGTPKTVKSSELRYLSKEFAFMPAQAFCAKLIGIKPLNGEIKFSTEVCQKFLELVQNKRLVAHVYQVAARERMQLEVILYDVENKNPEIVLNDYLIVNGLASPICRIEDSSSEVQQSVENLSSDCNGLSDIISLPQNGSSSPLRNGSTSLPASSIVTEENKPRRPPPGFEAMPTELDCDSFTPRTCASPMYSSNSQKQHVNNFSIEELQKIISNFYLINPDLIPNIVNNQYLPQSVYNPNPSNMPLKGPPLFHSQQNMPQRFLTYGSYVTQPQTYNPHPTMYRYVPSNYIPVNAAVPVPMPLFMNTPAPANLVQMNPPVLNQYYSVYQPPLQSSMNNSPSNMHARAGAYSLNSESMQVAPTRPSPVPTKATPPPSITIPDSTLASSPVYTPITVPEWPLKNLSVTYTSSSNSTTKAEFLESNQMIRPCTPLTPDSAEVANICKLSGPNSSTSHYTSPLNGYISDSLICQNIEVELENSRKNSDSSLSTKMGRQPNSKDNDLPMHTGINIKEIPLPHSSPERLYSAISSPVESSFQSSPIKEESSDDYASASEIVEEVTHQLSDLTLTEKCLMAPPKSVCETNEDIPDSWENLDLDDTPAKTANFFVDFSQPLELIIENNDCDLTSKRKSPIKISSQPEVKSQASPPLMIKAPLNWKDAFDPDSISTFGRVDNKYTVKENSPNPVKFDVKKIPLQKLEIQGKFIHLLYINKEPAVIAIEFFKQFVPKTNPTVSEKIVEASQPHVFYYISKAKYPTILAELDKLREFYGGVDKKYVIRLNKVRLINTSEIPQCLKILNAPNKPLLDDLQKITNQLKLC